MKHRSGLDAAPYVDFDYPRVAGLPSGGAWVAGSRAFRVEEVPLYPFSGEGEHVAVRVEKEGRTTRDVVLGVARRTGVAPSAVGYAGMKDKECTSVQAFTVLGTTEERARAAFEAEGCRVLELGRHGNKLRLGHLSGNRFAALLAGVEPSALEGVLRRLAAEGVPNFYGPQRFGARGDNARMGLKVLRREARVDRWKRDLFVSALQAFVFNEVLARRIEAATLREPSPGDVLRRADSGGLFLCEDPKADRPRLERLEVSATGPIHGRKMVRPQLAAAEAEAAVLRELLLSEGLFEEETGSRRPLTVGLGPWSVEPVSEGAWVSFACPAGTFATSVIRELTGGNLRRS
jgi:tRNA pseudouridine13 synthase